MRVGALIVELVFMIRDCGGVSGVARVIGDVVGSVFGANGASGHGSADLDELLVGLVFAGVD